MKSQTNSSKDMVSDIAEYLLAILDDIHERISTSYAKAELERDKQTILRRLRCEGLEFATRSLPRLIDYMLNCLESREQVIAGFAIRKGYPVFLGRLFKIVLRRECGEDQQVKAFEGLYMLSVSFKKLRGPYQKEKLLAQYREFLETDSNLPSVDGIDLEYAKSIVTRIIADFDYDTHIRPKPGPGATNLPLPHRMRYEPHTIFEDVDDVIPFSEFFYPLPTDVIQQARTYLALKRERRPSSRFCFVPKTYGKARGICIEHNEIQYLQQGVADWLRRRMVAVIGKPVDIFDQSTNAHHALVSSRSKELATLDLSDASDRISKSLIYKLFSGNPIFLDYLKVLSAVKITAPFEGVEDLEAPKKYAPMGSALCFPVMTLAIFALCLSVERAHGVPNRDSRVSVYGDDIVVSSKLAEPTIDLLQSVGLKVNSKKSYWKSDFRESCGLHAFKGCEVTPVYIKYVPGENDLTALQSSLANERDLYKKGYFHAAKLVRMNIRMRYEKIPFEYVHYSSPAIGFYRKVEDLPIGRPFREKFCKFVQERYYRVPCLIDKNFHDNITNQTSGLLRYWTKPVGETSITVRDGWGLLPFTTTSTNLSFCTPLRQPKVAWRWVVAHHV